MTTETGGRIPTTDTFGSPTRLPSDGPRITKATGIGSRPGDGPGSMIPPGAMLRSTMAAGSVSADAGDG